jgi:membrane-associated phospholipid phosphatase
MPHLPYSGVSADASLDPSGFPSGKSRWRAFMQARLAADGLFGKHFSIGTGVFSAAALMFAGLAVHVSSANWLTGLDERVSHWFNGHGEAVWTQVMFAISALHGAVGIPLYSILFVLLLARLKDWYWLAAVAGTTFGGMALNIGMKYIFRRGRPSFTNPLVHIATYSFPSGHTAGATVLYSVLAAYLMSRTRSIAMRYAIAALAALMVGWVGLSRIYLGAHYLSDVVGAVLEGLAWLAVCLTAVAMARRYRGG